MKKYYLKYNLVSKKFALDSVYRAEGNFYGVKRIQVDEKQAEEFVNRIKYKYIDKDKPINMTMIEHEFDSFFHVCKCGTATLRSIHVKRHRESCHDCYIAGLSDARKKIQADIAERKRLAKLKTYLKTEQGIIDTIGSRAIYTNVRIQVLKKNKTMNELAELLEIEPPSVSRMFNGNKSISAERLFKIAEWLLVPFDVLVKPPRGERFKKKNGIPVHVYKNPIKRIKDEL